MAIFGKKKPSPFYEIPVTEALTKGDVLCKLSAVVMGLSNICRKQVIKGLIFLAIEVAYIYYMVTFGFGAIGDLITLGTEEGRTVLDPVQSIMVTITGDNSMLCLLYGVITIFISLTFFVVWRESVKSGYNVYILARELRGIPTFIDDVKDLFNKNMHKTFLFFPLIGIIVFTIMPLFFMILMAFTNYDRDHAVPGELFDWVGLVNFKTALDFGGGFGKTFWPVLGWTITWAFFATFLNYICGMILAILINRKGTAFKSFWRFIFVLTIAVPQFVSLLIIRTMLQPEGAVNVMLRSIGFLSEGESLPFFTDVTWARVTIIVVNLWVGIPHSMLTCTGVLQNIPADLYESAQVDGANAFITFWKITLPYMLFITAPSLITAFIGNINNFNVIYLLSGGSPATFDYYRGTAGKTDLLVTWLYKLTIDNHDYCYGSVIGILIFIISATTSLAVYRNTGSYKNEEEFQ